MSINQIQIHDRSLTDFYPLKITEGLLPLREITLSETSKRNYLFNVLKVQVSPICTQEIRWPFIN